MKRLLLGLSMICILLSGCNRHESQIQKGTVGTNVSGEFTNEVSVSQPDKQEKQEITLAFLYEDSRMQAIIEDFNVQSQEYQVNFVTYVKPGEMALGKVEEIESELKKGNGPDILHAGMVDLDAYVKKGYLQSLDGVVQEELFLQAAVETGKYKGVIYGIPYAFTPMTLMVSEELAAGKDTWTLQEMMETIKDSGAKKFMCGCDGVAIINYCALAGRGEEAFINWEENVCDFDNSDFCELLEFARDYADIHMADPNKGNAIQKGEVAAMCRRVLSLLEMNYYDAVFENQTNYIGFPCEQGKTNYVEAQCLYMNANSTKKEGVEAFLKFLLSEEAQNEQMDMLLTSFGARGPFSVRLSSIEYYIESQKANHKGDKAWEQGSDGINFYYSAMTEIQEKQFREILEHCIPVDEKRRDINSIVEEVTATFFEGEQSAEYVAGKLQSAIQEYLNQY